MTTPNTPARVDDHAPAPARTTPERGHEVGTAAIEAEAAVIMAAAPVVETLTLGGMAPARYMPDFKPTKSSPAQGYDVARAKALAAAVYGATLGFGVSKSLQNVFTVHGTPAIYARTMVALAMAQGHEVWEGDKGPEAVTVYARRRGSDKVHEATWTMARAEAAGYTSNAKYQQNAEEMLYAKAAATVCRRAFPDVLEGVPYTVEEMEMEGPRVKATAERQDTPRQVKPRGLAAVKAAASAPAPAAEPVDAAPEPPAYRPEPDTPAAIIYDQIRAARTADDLNTAAADVTTALEAGDITPDDADGLRAHGRHIYENGPAEA